MAKGPMTKEEPGTAVATVQSAGGLLTLDDVPDFLRGDVQQYAGAGVSERPEDMAMPFLGILQKGSPQVNKRDPKYVEGAEPGDFINTATNKLYKGDEANGGGVIVLPFAFEAAEVEWVPRDQGGGFVSKHPADTPLARMVRIGPKGERMLDNGHQLVTTAYHYVITEDDLDPCVLGLTSTQLGESRRWMSLRKQFKVTVGNAVQVVPAWARRYKLSTAWKQNEKGDWFVLRVADAGWNTNKFSRDIAAKLFEGFQKGLVTAAQPDDDGVAAGGGAQEPVPDVI